MKGKPTKWSDADIAYLKENFPHKWNKDLAKHFNVGWRTIVRKAKELKLEKSGFFRDSIDFTSFGKGRIPWNKGMKGKVLSPGCEATWFKKGHKTEKKIICCYCGQQSHNSNLVVCDALPNYHLPYKISHSEIPVPYKITEHFILTTEY